MEYAGRRSGTGRTCGTTAASPTPTWSVVAVTDSADVPYNPQDMSPATDQERQAIRAAFDTVYVASFDRKQHVYQDCPRADPDASDKPIGVFPGDHLDVCQVCVVRWRQATAETGRPEGDHA